MNTKDFTLDQTRGLATSSATGCRLLLQPGLSGPLLLRHVEVVLPSRSTVEHRAEPARRKLYISRLQPACARQLHCTVDMKDTFIVAKAFGTSSGPPIDARWNFRCDINNDRLIDMKDLGLVAKWFGNSSAPWTPALIGTRPNQTSSPFFYFCSGHATLSPFSFRNQ